MSDLFQIITQLPWLLAFISGYYLYLLTSFFINYRKGKVINLMLIAGYGIMTSLPILSEDTFNITTMLVFHIIILLLLTQASFSNRLAVLLIFFPMIAAFSYFRYNNPLNYAIFYSFADVNNYPKTIQHIYRIFTSLLILSIFYLLYHNLKNRIVDIKKYISNKDWCRIEAVCILPFLAVFTALLFPPSSRDMMNTSHLKGNMISFFLMAGAIISDLGIICFIQPLIENVKMRQEQQIYQLQADYYHTLEKQQKQVRKIRHDMNNHMQMIQGYLSEGDIPQAAEYLSQFEMNLKERNGRVFCSDTALNAVINDQYQKLLEEKADVHFNIDINNLKEIYVYDLCTIFSNALSNALEASRNTNHIELRKVQLQARCQKGYFSFHISNYKENLVTEEGGILVTSKMQKTDHGYGIENIREIVKKYGGNMEINYQDNIFALFFYIKLG